MPGACCPSVVTAGSPEATVESVTVVDDEVTVVCSLDEVTVGPLVTVVVEDEDTVDTKVSPLAEVAVGPEDTVDEDTVVSPVGTWPFPTRMGVGVIISHEMEPRSVNY